MANRKLRKKVCCMKPGMVMPSCPTSSAAIRVLETIPRLNEPNFNDPTQKPIASVRNRAISG